MEPGVLLPDASASVPMGPQVIDHRGWLMAIITMVLIGVWSLRPAPAPQQPERVPCAVSESWMADALPGIGAKTRESHWQKIRAGDVAKLPERTQSIAQVIFIWPDQQPATPTTGKVSR